MRVNGLCVSIVLMAAACAACTGARATELDAVPPGEAGVLPATPADDVEPDVDPGPGPKTDGGKSDGGKPDSGTKPDDEEEIVTLCDDGLALASTSAGDAAKAIGLCAKASPGSKKWGVLEARWAKPDGSPTTNSLSWGLLPKLGSLLAPSGKVMLALSTGTARGPSDPGYVSPANGWDKGYTHAAPTNQPKRSSVCAVTDPAPGAAHDGVALELKIRVPASAKSMSFTHQLFTSDTPADACGQYNDVFVAMMDPKPLGTDGNIVFDALGDGVGINSTSLLRACAPGTFNGLVFTCPLGVSSLAGTGFDNKAATGWLRTTVAVQSGTDITMRFAIWDSGDGIIDSTVLIDELAFSAQTAGAAQTVPR
jgi:hypothetical protein